MLLHSISCHCVLFNGIKWYWMVLHGAYNVMVQIMSWYCKVLHFLARHPIVLHGIVWYWIVLHWIDRYLIVLNDIAWCCVLLNGIALYWLINLVLHCMLLNAIALYSNHSRYVPRCALVFVFCSCKLFEATFVIIQLKHRRNCKCCPV